MTDNKLAGDKTRPCWQLEIAQPPKWSGQRQGSSIDRAQQSRGGGTSKGWWGCCSQPQG